MAMHPFLCSLLFALLIVKPAPRPSLEAAVASTDKATVLLQRFQAPQGCTRTNTAANSFAHYLRNLPLRPVGTPVLLYNGSPKGKQDVHAAVVDISTGTKDLQQCADAVMRLRAEYLYASGQQDKIGFHLTNGFHVPWQRWRKGERVKVSGNTCTWTSGAAADGSHAQLLRYLEFVFTYAGTLSLHKELQPAGDRPLQPGDVFIQGGSPGHAVLVLDVARHTDGSIRFLLGQSYMPAQDFHVLRSPGANDAWYTYKAGSELRTPEWTFAWSDRRVWPE